MKKIGLLVFLMGNIWQLNAQDHGNLHVIVTNIKQSEGSIQLAIYNSEETFMKDALSTQTVKADTSGTVLVVFSDLPYGDYALSIFHDINDNEELDTNFMGIPKEPFGFSNNSMGAFGPPSFEKASINVKEPDTQTGIKLKSF